MRSKSSVLAGTALWSLAVCYGGMPAAAQEVVQPLPPPGASALGAAMRRLASNPRDLTALIDAGEAATSVGDLDAALGFYARAAEVSPGSGRIKLGIATVYARQRRPVEALRLFAEAEKAGIAPISMAAERGLCFDLVGDGKSAQDNYRLALTRGPDPELTRRLALSQAIAGDKGAFETTLLPLLQKGDLAGFRTRAFGLAVLGDTAGAVKIAEDMMPREMAARMTPYLRYMNRLTPAQQAAAGNLGVFPRSASLAAGEVRVATATQPGVGGARPAEARPEPAKRPKPDRSGGRQVRNAAADPIAASAGRASPPPPPPPPPAAVGPASNARGADRPTPLAATLAAGTGQAGKPTSSSAAPVTISTLPKPDLGPQPATGTGPAISPSSPQPAPPSVSAATPVAATVAPVAAQTLPPAAIEDAAPANVADAFAEWALPPGSGSTTPSAGAVDITRIEIAREAPPQPKVAASAPAKPDPKATTPAPAKPKQKTAKELHPARSWVQLATGRNQSALAFDWKRFDKKAAGKLSGLGPFTTPWVEAHRLLAGPFPTAAAAKDLVKRLKALGLDAFTYDSPAGEEIKPLK